MRQLYNMYFVHGMGSSKESGKFKKLQERYEGIECLEWKVGDDLRTFINESVLKIKKNAISNNRTNVIISSAIGANLAMQIQFHLMKIGLGVSMVMVNPLFKKSQLLDEEEIPQDVLKYIHPIKMIRDCLIIIGDCDTVINHNEIPKGIIAENNFIEVLDNSHKLEDFEECFDDIDLYIVSNFYDTKLG